MMPQALKQESPEEIQEERNTENENVAAKTKKMINEMFASYETKEQIIRELKLENERLKQEKARILENSEKIQKELDKYKETNDKLVSILCPLQKNTPENQTRTTDANEVENEAESEVENNSKNEVQSEAKNEAESEADNKAEDKAEYEAESEAEDKAEEKAENEAENEAEDEAEDEPENEAEDENETENNRKRKRASVDRQTTTAIDEDEAQSVSDDDSARIAHHEKVPKLIPNELIKSLLSPVKLNSFSSENKKMYRLCIILPPNYNFRDDDLGKQVLRSPDQKSKLLMLNKNSKEDLNEDLRLFIDEIRYNKFWHSVSKQENLLEYQLDQGHIILRFIVSSSLKAQRLLLGLSYDEYDRDEFMEQGQYHTEAIDGVEPYQFIEISHHPSLFWAFSSKIVDSLADDQEYQGDDFFREMRRRNMEKRGDNQTNFWYNSYSRNMTDLESLSRLLVNYNYSFGQ